MTDGTMNGVGVEPVTLNDPYGTLSKLIAVAKTLFENARRDLREKKHLAAYCKTQLLKLMSQDSNAITHQTVVAVVRCSLRMRPKSLKKKFQGPRLITRRIFHPFPAEMCETLLKSARSAKIKDLRRSANVNWFRVGWYAKCPR